MLLLLLLLLLSGIHLILKAIAMWRHDPE